MGRRRTILTRSTGEQVTVRHDFVILPKPCNLQPVTTPNNKHEIEFFKGVVLLRSVT